MTEPKTRRRDARDNAAKLRAAALDLFLEQGLEVSLSEVAKAAGVSIGTLYNHFGSREALIDAVVPEVAGARLQGLAATVAAQPTARARLETFVRGMIDLQQQDPALNDAVLRRFPDAVALLQVCDLTMKFGSDLAAAAHDEGSLSPTFTSGDLFNLLWLAGTAGRDPHAPDGWRTVLEKALEASWT